MAGNVIADLQIKISATSLKSTTTNIEKLSRALTRLDIIANATSAESSLARIANASEALRNSMSRTTKAITANLKDIGKSFDGVANTANSNDTSAIEQIGDDAKATTKDLDGLKVALKDVENMAGTFKGKFYVSASTLDTVWNPNEWNPQAPLSVSRAMDTVAQSTGVASKAMLDFQANVKGMEMDSIYNATQRMIEQDTAVKQLQMDTIYLQGEEQGLYKWMDNIGKVTPKATSKISALGGQFMRLMKIKILRLIITQILEGISEGFKNAYQWSKEMGDSLATDVDNLYSSLGQMKNQIGSFVGELFQSLAPVLQVLVDLAFQLANALAKIFAAARGEDKYKKAIRQNLSYAGSMDTATASAKELQRTILGFDELNILNGEGGTHGGGAGASGNNYADMYEYADTELNLVEGILAGAINMANTSFSAFGLLGDGVNALWNAIFNHDEEALPSWFDELGDWINGLTGVSAWLRDVSADISGFMWKIAEDIKAFTANLSLDIKVLWIKIKKGFLNGIADIIDAIRESPVLQVILQLLGVPVSLFTEEMSNAVRSSSEALTLEEGALRGATIAKKAHNEATKRHNQLTNEQFVADSKSGQVFHKYADELRNATTADKEYNSVAETTASTLGQLAVTTYQVKNSTSKASEKTKQFRDHLGEVSAIRFDKFQTSAKNNFEKADSPLKTVEQRLDHINRLRNITVDVKLNISEVVTAGANIARQVAQATRNTYASGGFPTTGEMFIAREAGAEMVGTINGRTAVANNADIVQAISQGVYEAMVSASGRGEQTTSVNVFMDSVAVAKATQRGNQVLNRSFNMTLA